MTTSLPRIPRAGRFPRSGRVLLMLAPLVLGAWITLLGCPPPVSAAPADVTGMPNVTIRDNVSRTVLKNGLTVLVVEDPAFDIVAVEMLFRVGQVNEDDATAGITHLIQNILVKRITRDAAGGTKDSAGKYIDGVEARGSMLNASANPDYAEISLLTDTSNLVHLLTSMARSVAHRDFTDEEVNGERNRLVEFLESDQRVFRAIYEIFLTEFYRYHPYRQPQNGHAASVRQLTRLRLEKYFSKYWAPNRTVVAVVGNVDRKKVIRILEEQLAGVPQVEDKRMDVAWEPKAVEKELLLASQSNLAWIFLGFPAPGIKSPDYPPMKILSTVLGEGLSSRLWVELRERRGLAYELGSLYPELEGPSHMIEYMVTTPKQLREGQKRIFKEIERIRSERISNSELDDAKRRLIGAYLLEHETNKGRALNLGLAELIGGGYQYDLQTVERIRRVTADDVLRVAHSYLKDYTLVVARPRDPMDIFR